MTNTLGTNVEEDARAFIDRIIDINQRHGMGAPPTEDVYERAVRETAQALRRMTATQEVRQAE